MLAASAMDLLENDPKDPDEARRRVDEASTLLLSTDDPWAQAYGWADRLRVLWATAPRDEALAAALGTLEIADRLGEVQESEGGRAEVFSVWTEIYQWLAGRLLADAETEGDPELVATAFSVGERMRARLLLESLSAAGVGTATGPGRADPDLEAAWRGLERRLVRVHRQLLDPQLAPEARQELLVELDDLEPEEDRLAAQRSRLRGTTATRPDHFLRLDELRGGLADDEAVLAFQVGLWQALDGSFAGGAWLMAVTRDDSRFYRLPDRVELEPAVTVFLDTFARRDGLEAEPAAALYDQLLRQALESLPPQVDRLIVIPDGPLHRLPFAALREAPDGPPLASRYELFVTPSATAWQRLRSLGSPEKRDQPVLAVVDPMTPGGVPAGEAVAAGGERSWTAGVRLARLPHAREEGREALDDLGEPGRLLLGADATERAVKQGTSRGLRLLHFGTHAILDEVPPAPLGGGARSRRGRRGRPAAAARGGRSRPGRGRGGPGGLPERLRHGPPGRGRLEPRPVLSRRRSPRRRRQPLAGRGPRGGGVSRPRLRPPRPRRHRGPGASPGRSAKLWTREHPPPRGPAGRSWATVEPR